MRRAVLLISVVALVLSATAPHSTQGSGREATIYRDAFGIPHIYAPDLVTAAYAVGYAQAEDRLEELLKNYRKATGHMAEVFGPEHFQHDVIQRMWRHDEVSREKYGMVSPGMRAIIESYQEGIRRFMREHPERVPAWAQEIHPSNVIALSRYIIFGWPLGEAASDLRRGGVQPDPIAYRGSNQMLIAPSRTRMNAAMAVIDPHLSWYGEFRFYQIKIYAGDFNVSGVSILGVPIPSLGHSRHASVAMTTGGPDTSDVYEELINPENSREYMYDGEWRDMSVLKVRIGVKDGDRVVHRDLEFEYTHHGPVVARRNNRAYTFANPYAEEVGLSDQVLRMMTARDLEEMKTALASLQLMAQNIMVATVHGDIFYVRNGRVPFRARGVDPSRPIPGHTSANEWAGLHPFADLVQITNPPHGYMHNCNVTPFAMMKDSPLTPERYSERPYLYNATREAPRHQRGEMMTELLHEATRVTEEEIFGIAFSPRVWKAETWQERIRQAYGKASGVPRDVAAVHDLISGWNRRSDAESEGALAFYAFKKGLGGEATRAVEPPPGLSDEQVMTALQKGAEWLRATFGDLKVPYGRFFRVGRAGGDRTYPVAGGSVNDHGMATPRAIGFSPVGKEMVGRSGQTSVQIVIMTNPPRSWTVVPLGHSDHRNTPHWDDQAEKLFSKSKAAPSFFMDRQELMKHVKSTKKLTVDAASAAR